MKTVLIRQAFRRAVLVTTLLLATVTLVACAAPQVPPTESLNMAREAITNAEQADARRYAGAELEEANRQLDAADKAVASEKMTEAERLARQARVAAELAVARTEAAKAAAINREMGRGADALDEEMRRQGEPQ